MKRAALALLLLAAAGCDERAPIPDVVVAVRMSPAPAEVEIGRSFALTVVRTWSADLEPDPWSDGALLPLVLRPIDVARRTDGRHVEETRRFRAYAFEPGVLAVPAVGFAAAPKAGGPPRTAAADGFSIKVQATLDPKTAGPPELPDLSPEPSRWPLWTAAGLAALAAGAFFVRASARRTRAQAGTAAPATPRERALARIALLEAQAPRTPEEVEAWHVEAASAVRDWLAEARGIPARERTTAEVLAAAGASGGFARAQRDALAAVLPMCDLVKFARHGSDAGERARLAGSARTAVSGDAP